MYGLGGKDHFYIHGNVGEGVLIRAIGGVDEDTFVDESKVVSLCVYMILGTPFHLMFHHLYFEKKLFFYYFFWNSIELG